MRITSFEVSDLLGKPGVFKADLHPDLNILTGRNGVGKTSLLKLLWYVMSGNILLALQEVSFSKLRLVTDQYDCTVHRLTRATCRVELHIGDRDYLFEDEEDDEGNVHQNAEDLANSRLIKIGNSVFLPTFRRIEGGFTLTNNRAHPTPRNSLLDFRPRNAKSDIEDAMIALSKRLTNGQHIFVSAISTADIVGLLPHAVR